VIAACQNVADALRVVQSDANALTAAVAAERAAATTLNITRRQLELSQVAYLLFINAENSYEQAIISLVQARAPRYGNTAALFQALGGGWWNRPVRQGSPRRHACRPLFRHAVSQHRLLDAIQTASETGITQTDRQSEIRIIRSIVLIVSKFMNNPISINRNPCLRLLLMVPAICLLGFTGCSSIDPPAGKNQTGDYVTIGATAFDSESQSFDRPWPFGCSPADRPTYQRSTNCL